MKLGAAVFIALAATCFTAFAGDYEITVDRKREKGGSGGNQATVKASQNWTGEVNILNRAFNASPNLTARYVIYVKRQKLGEAENAERIDKVSGTFNVPSIKGGTKASFTTIDVVLNNAHMAPGWKMVEGRQSAQDSLVGIWLRLYNGQVQVAEYINPTTLTAKFKFE
jgi:hypothetical protein